MIVTVLVVGALIAFGSFAFAAMNITSGGDFDGMFRSHGLAMVGMALGGLLLAVGFVMGSWQVIQSILVRL